MEEWDSTQIVCRVCLTETGDFQTVFTSVELEDTQSTMHLSEMICSFTKVQITLGDGLPEQICMTCAEEAIKTYFFKLRCEESDKLLRKRLLEFQEHGNTPVSMLNLKVEAESTNNLNIVELGDNHRDLLQDDVLDDFEHSLENIGYDCSEDESDDEEVNFYKLEKTFVEKIKEFECDICNKRFSREDLLLRHKIAHAMKMQEFKDEEEAEEDKKLEINEVNDGSKKNNIKNESEVHGSLQLNNASKAIEKAKTSSQLPIYMCPICLHDFYNDEILNKHFVEEHMQVCKEEDKEVFACKLCNYRLEDLSYFKRHIKSDHDIRNKKYSCPYCLMKYTKEGHLKNHLKFHKPFQRTNKDESKNNEFSCNHCNKKFSIKEEFDKHLHKVRILGKKGSARKKPHVCDICLKAFNQISNLKDHLRTHNGEKPFLCPTCGKGFNQLGNLRQHQVRHSGVKSHICSTCGSGFASKGELHAHLRKHTGVRPFVCDTCGNSFTTSSSLTKHKRIHSGEKPYECDYCKMKFSRSGILSRHRRIHTGEKPYICKFCSKAFTQSNDLNSHQRIHTGEKPYICDQCGQSFRQSSALRTHKRTHLASNLERSQQKSFQAKKEKVFVEDQEQISIVP